MIVILSGAEGSLRFLGKLGMTGVAWNDRDGLLLPWDDSQVMALRVIAERLRTVPYFIWMPISVGNGP